MTFNLQISAIATIGGLQKVTSPHPYLSDIEYAKNYTKMAESAKALGGQQVTTEFLAWLKLQKHKHAFHSHCMYPFLISVFLLLGLHAVQRHLCLHVQERHRAQAANDSNRDGTPNKQIHAGESDKKGFCEEAWTLIWLQTSLTGSPVGLMAEKDGDGVMK